MERHRWGAREPKAFKTERQCLKCDLVKVTMREIDGHGHTTYWTEWWRGDEQIHSKNTPPCVPIAAQAVQETERNIAA